MGLFFYSNSKPNAANSIAKSDEKASYYIYPCFGLSRQQLIFYR